MRVRVLVLLAVLGLAACHGQNGSDNSGPQGPTTSNATSGRGSGANGTPSGSGAT